MPRREVQKPAFDFPELRQAATFLALDDTPDAYTGHAGKVMKVNASENALEPASMSQFATNDEISLGSIPLSLYTPQNVTGTTHTALKLIDNTTVLEFYIQDKPTAPSGFSLKGRLYAFIRTNSIGTTAYIELWNATAASQIVQLPTTGLAFEVKSSDLFDIPASSQATQIRIWDSDASYQAQFRGGWIELIGVKN